MGASIALHKVAYHAKYTLQVMVTVSQLHEKEALYARESTNFGCDVLNQAIMNKPSTDCLTDFY